MAVRVLVIDNVDSFTFTLVDYLRQLGVEVQVARSSDLDVAEAMAVDAAMLIGPGPGRPEEGGISVPLAAACIAQRRPLLGVCLGHQAIAVAAGGRIDRAPPMHGRIDRIAHNADGLFEGLPTPIAMTRYHSLVASELPRALVANAWGSDGTVQGLRHATAPVHGVQFHPESIGSEHGLRLLANFVAVARRCSSGLAHPFRGAPKR